MDTMTPIITASLILMATIWLKLTSKELAHSYRNTSTEIAGLYRCPSITTLALQLAREQQRS